MSVKTTEAQRLEARAEHDIYISDGGSPNSQGLCTTQFVRDLLDDHDTLTGLIKEQLADIHHLKTRLSMMHSAADKPPSQFDLVTLISTVAAPIASMLSEHAGDDTTADQLADGAVDLARLIVSRATTRLMADRLHAAALPDARTKTK